MHWRQTDSTEPSRLADFSGAVRESSLKRFRAIPVGLENWRPLPTALSIAEIGRHLVHADRWLFKKLANPDLTPLIAEAGSLPLLTRGGYEALLGDLEQTGQQRAALLRRLTHDRLLARIPDPRFGGEASVWWVVVRGNLDHEIHHRGQLSTYQALLAKMGGAPQASAP